MFLCAGCGAIPASDRDEDILPDVAQTFDYPKLITTLQTRGFQIWDFKTYWAADKNSLPNKLIVMRHDVHAKDVANAYVVYSIEKNLGNSFGSYYVMLDMPPEAHEPDYHPKRLKYLALIQYLRERNIEVQPHVSPLNIYTNYKLPGWPAPGLNKLRRIFDYNYRVDQFIDGIDLVTTRLDVFNVREMNETLALLMPLYNLNWEQLTGIPVYSYSGHGTRMTMNQLISNGMILNQRFMLEKGFYQFEVYNSQIFHNLEYLSDNFLPSWMDHPDEIVDGRYEMLIHPSLWGR